MSLATPTVQSEIARRRTFAIISHPDAGKTTITEKLLLFGNAIHMAGAVKAKRAQHFATSDWMKIEQQRGISVTSSVMQFTYDGCDINLLDTPGHADFSEDTYRVLTAVDSALMAIDSAKGIETQTKKLFQICRDRRMPIMTFLNKLDMPGRDPFELIQEIETLLQMPCTIRTWPIGQGDRFIGVYDLQDRCIRLFPARQKVLAAEPDLFTDLADPQLATIVGPERLDQLHTDLTLIDGAGHPFSRDEYLAGLSTPVFFGSAVNNFGIQELLAAIVQHAPSARPRAAESRLVEPTEDKFSGVIFKIQANMDPKHRDRVAFVRICSGEFTPGMTLRHVRLARDVKINHALQFLSQQRSTVEQAVAGDIIGLHDRGTFMIGDTLTQGEPLKFLGIPQFSPDYFSLVLLKNPIKMKQLMKGLEQLSEEGASQLFRRKYNSDAIIGVVGQLQFEVVQFRLLHEYGAEATFSPLHFACSRWYRCGDPKAQEDFESYYRDQIVYDVRGYPVMLFKTEWEQQYVEEKNPALTFYDNLLNYEQPQ